MNRYNSLEEFFLSTGLYKAETKLAEFPQEPRRDQEEADGAGLSRGVGQSFASRFNSCFSDSLCDFTPHCC